MKQKLTKAQWLLVILLVINLTATGILLAVTLGNKSPADAQQSRYVLYIGTNDKNTNLPKIPLEQRRDIVRQTCTQYDPAPPYWTARGFGQATRECWQTKTRSSRRDRSQRACHRQAAACATEPKQHLD